MKRGPPSSRSCGAMAWQGKGEDGKREKEGWRGRTLVLSPWSVGGGIMVSG